MTCPNISFFAGLTRESSAIEFCIADGNNLFVAEQNEAEYGQDELLTPAERRYLEQWQKIKLRRFAKTAKKSHRDRIQEFNQYLANLSEHYDIPKVGPG